MVHFALLYIGIIVAIVVASYAAARPLDSAAPANSAGASSNAALGGGLCPSVSIGSDADFEAVAPYTRNCAVVGGLSIAGFTGTTAQLAAAFVNLRVVTGSLYLGIGSGISPGIPRPS